LDKTILKDYIDAVALIQETEEDIQRLKKKRRTIVTGNVKGSNPEFPYNPQHFKIAGSAFTYADDGRLRCEEGILEERKAKAEKLRLQAEQVINRMTPRMQRIFRFRLREKLSWEQVADRMGGGATGDSLRMEFNRFLEKK